MSARRKRGRPRVLKSVSALTIRLERHDLTQLRRFAAWRAFRGKAPGIRPAILDTVFASPQWKTFTKGATR